MADGAAAGNRGGESAGNLSWFYSSLGGTDRFDDDDDEDNREDTGGS
jgi:hypothetical protein